MSYKEKPRNQFILHSLINFSNSYFSRSFKIDYAMCNRAYLLSYKKCLKIIKVVFSIKVYFILRNNCLNPFSGFQRLIIIISI